MSPNTHYKAFDKGWFKKNQRVLLWLLNNTISKKLFRYLLRIENKEKIVRILPNSYTVLNTDGSYSADFRTHQKYSKRIYYSFKPLWWTLHYWDLLIADRFIPKLSYGFLTLTQYPGSIGANNPVDGQVTYNPGGVTALTWATVRNAADGDSFSDTAASDSIYVALRDGTLHYALLRSFFLYDTSSLTASATISAAVISFAADGSSGVNADSTRLEIVSSSPASNTGLALADYDQRGSTAFGNIAYTSWVSTDGTYNDVTLNASGITNISKTGISKFAGVCGRDFDDAAPTGTNQLSCYYSDQSGTTKDPKLVITYTLPGSDALFFGTEF